MPELAGSARNFSLYVDKNPNRFDFGMKDVRAEFKKSFPELKRIQHMNEIAKIMLVVDYTVLMDKTGLEYSKGKQNLIKDACKVILGID